LNNPKEVYEQKRNEAAVKEATFKKQATSISYIRGIIFLVTALYVYFFWENFIGHWPAIFLPIAVFLYLVKKYENVKTEMLYWQKVREINETELRVSDGDFHHLPTGGSYLQSGHAFSHDIDLFGHGSFFQFINRTTTIPGKNLLAGIFNSNETNNIHRKQEAIKELSDKVDFRQDFSAKSMMVETEPREDKMLAWFNDQVSEESQIIKFGVPIFGAISLGLIIAASLGWIDPTILMIWFFVGLGIVAIGLKKTNNVASHVSKYSDTISQYAYLIQGIEEESFSSEILEGIQKNIRTEETKASGILSQLSSIINLMNHRNSVLIAVILNGLFLYDYYCIHRLKTWIRNHADQIGQWFKSIYKIDAYNSLAGYAYNHPQYVYPTLTDGGDIIQAKALGHPQILRAERIDNDFSISKDQFIIITGANMAGKSTFLRTVALHIVLCNCGLPAAAEKMSYRPIKLISSMRTSDSLKDQESYFFSELKRLKHIIDQVNQEEHFIILDEILKGTNSKDKEEGSKKFVKKLISIGATGIIATHDLSLCKLSEEHNEVINKYFDAEIVNDELFFDYTFKNGVCQNMNASFLLKKMEIV